MKTSHKDFDISALISSAIDAQQLAYAPYSCFKVGSAILTSSGEIIQGCNIENAAYTPSNCAERTAVFKAVSNGYREFVAIAIVGGDRKTKGQYCPPCGVCRQVLLEFCDYDDFMVILANDVDDYQVFSLSELIPHAFKKENL